MVLTFFLASGCDSSTLSSTSSSQTAPSVSPPLSAFYATGWQPNGLPLTLAIPKASGNCSYRLGPVLPNLGGSRVGLMRYTSCSLDSSGALILPMPSSGQMDGTFRIDVSFDGGITNKLSQSFYVHPSLNGVSSCPQLSPSTVDQVFLTAANYLDTSLRFGPKTSLEAPFLVFDFPPIPSVPSSPFLFGDNPSSYTSFSSNAVYSLRKRFEMNNQGNLVFFQRVWSRTQGARCELTALGAYLLSVQQSSAALPLSQMMSSIYSNFVGSLSQLKLSTGQGHCVAAVFNALGRGICFDSSVVSNPNATPVAFFTGIRRNTALSKHNIVSPKVRVSSSQITGMGRNNGNRLAAPPAAKFIRLDD